MPWPKKIIELSFCALFIFVPLIWLSATSELFEFNKIILTYILTTIIIGSWLIRMILEGKIIFRRTILDLPLLLFLISNFSSLIFSIDPHTSWFGYYSRFNGGLLSLLSYSLLYWSYVSNMSHEATQKSIKCLLFSAIPIALWGALEHFGFSPSCLLTIGKWDVSCWIQDVQNRVFSTLGQPNWLAAYLVALIFIPLSHTLRKSSYFYSLISIFLFITLLFTKSRSGLLAFGISSVIFWGLILIKHSPFPSPPDSGGDRGGVLKSFAIFSISVLIFSISIKNPIKDLIFKSQVTEKTIGPALEVGGTESGSIRKIVWSGALKIWRASPKNFWLGSGPETFAMAYYQYRPVEHNNTSEWELLYNKAHNEFLNYLATTGLLGLISYSVLLITMVWQMLKNPLSTALLAGFTSIIVTNFWGFSVVIVQLFLFLFPAIAICLKPSQQS